MNHIQEAYSIEDLISIKITFLVKKKNQNKQKQKKDIP